MLLLSAIRRAGRLFNESAFINQTIDQVVRLRLTGKIWGLVKREGRQCENPNSQNIVAYGLLYLHDLILAGGSNAVGAVDAGGMTLVVEHCHDVQLINRALFDLLILITETPANRVALRGVGGSIGSAIARAQFGPAVLPALKFFALWSQRDKLGWKDTNGACRVAAVALENQEMWRKDYYAAYCLLARNLVCPAMDVDVNERLLKRDECQQILQQFPERPPEL
jgi:hypothetical protein